MNTLSGPVLINTTREIRKRSPIKCRIGDQGAHLLGLNLLKILFNFYSQERDVVVSDAVIAQLKEDINRKANFACETPEENTNDKETEEEVLALLLHGTLRYRELSRPSKVMFARLRQLLLDINIHMTPVRDESLEMIRQEIEEGVFPLLATK